MRLFKFLSPVCYWIRLWTARRRKLYAAASAAYFYLAGRRCPRSVGEQTRKGTGHLSPSSPVSQVFFGSLSNRIIIPHLCSLSNWDSGARRRPMYLVSPDTRNLASRPADVGGGGGGGIGSLLCDPECTARRRSFSTSKTPINRPLQPSPVGQLEFPTSGCTATKTMMILYNNNKEQQQQQYYNLCM
jgi:hypothetical protein